MLECVESVESVCEQVVVFITESSDCPESLQVYPGSLDGSTVAPGSFPRIYTQTEEMKPVQVDITYC